MTTTELVIGCGIVAILLAPRLVETLAAVAIAAIAAAALHGAFA